MSDIKTEYLEVEGRCLCGGVTYRVSGERSGMIVCHCQRCRKHLGAAYGHFTVFESGRFTWVTGQDLLSCYPSVHGPEGRSFCRVCGTSMPGPSQGKANLGGILAGHCLDMPPVDLIFHVYTGSRCPWTQIPENAHQWERVPPHFQDPELVDLERSTDTGAITGSCLCGAVGFAATDPIVMMNCHCTRCRLSRGAAHATNLFVPTEKFRWCRGESEIVDYKLPEARRFGAAFCRTCGGLVPRLAGPNRDRMNIPAGCLDVDPGIEPQGHIFVDSKALWFEITDKLRQWPSAATRQA